MSKSGKITVALTGATGFLGGHLLHALLASGFNVKALTRKPRGFIDGVKWVPGDLHEESALLELCKDAGVVIHCAGAIKSLNRAGFFRANTEGTLHLANAARTRRCERFIHISSLAAREGDLSHYSASKAAAEDIFTLRSWPFEWAIIRPPGIYGPGDMETLDIFKMINKGFMLAPGSRQNKVSWIHVEDMATAIVAALGEFPFGRIIEIDDGVGGYSHAEFCEAAAHVLGKDPLLLVAPPFLVKGIGLLGGLAARARGKPNILTLPKARELVHSDWVVNPGLAPGFRKWHPRYTLTTGLENAIEWYRQNGFL